MTTAGLGAPAREWLEPAGAIARHRARIEMRGPGFDRRSTVGLAGAG